MRHLIVLLVASCVVTSCSGDSTKPQAVVPNDVIGLWQGGGDSSVLSISQTVFRPGYIGVWVQGGPDTCAFSRFEIQVAAPPASFTGRHQLCPVVSDGWSDSNMVHIALADREHLRLRYLDVEGGEWDYVRGPSR